MEHPSSETLISSSKVIITSTLTMHQLYEVKAVDEEEGEGGRRDLSCLITWHKPQSPLHARLTTSAREVWSPKYDKHGHAIPYMGSNSERSHFVGCLLSSHTKHNLDLLQGGTNLKGPKFYDWTGPWDGFDIIWTHPEAPVVISSCVDNPPRKLPLWKNPGCITNGKSINMWVDVKKEGNQLPNIFQNISMYVHLQFYM